MLYQILVIDLDNYIQVMSHSDEFIVNNLMIKNNDMYISGNADNANLVIQKNINNKTKYKYPTNLNLIPHKYYINNNIPTNLQNSVHYRFFLVGKYERNIQPDEYSYLNLVLLLIFFCMIRLALSAFPFMYISLFFINKLFIINSST